MEWFTPNQFWLQFAFWIMFGYVVTDLWSKFTS